MAQRDPLIPPIAYHWTAASAIPAIKREGLHTSVGGYEGYHGDEPGVNLTLSGHAPSEYWNANIFWIARPVRISVDTARLDHSRFGPDLNSLLNEDTLACVGPDEADLSDSRAHTLANSLRFTENFRYLGPIPPAALIAFDAFEPHPDWKLEEED